MSDKDSKTEQATPHKLRESRRKGQVARSKEIPSTLIFLAAVIYFWIQWDWLVDEIKTIIIVPAELYNMEFKQALSAWADYALGRIIYTIVLPFSFLILITGIIGNVLQFGVPFSFDPILPKYSKIDPVEGFKRIFSMKSVIKTLFSIFKIIIAGVILLFIARMAIEAFILDVKQCNVLCMKDTMETLIKYMVLALLTFLIIIAILDFIFQKHQFSKDQMMSKDEIKREYKSREGDPEIKGQRRQLQRELLNQDIGEKIKMSRLLVAGHRYMIAIQYDDEMPLPLILSIGQGGTARQMTDIAKKENIPIIANPRLAELLKEEGEVDQYIPESSISGIVQAIQQAAAEQ